MKSLIILLIFFGFINVNGQDKNIDKDAIEFKAKLFTISEFGIADKEIILNDIENQNLIFLETDYNVENATAYLDFLQRIGILDANGSFIRSYDGHGKGDGSGQRANEYGAMKDLE